MTKLIEPCRHLEEIWYKKIPLSKAMSMRAIKFDESTLKCSASLEPNTNVHGTAFAGSLYAIQALAGWSMVYLQLRLLKVSATIVIAKGSIDYAKPVAEEILVECKFPDKTTFAEDLVRNEKARIELSTSVTLKNDDVASSFSGIYAIKKI